MEAPVPLVAINGVRVGISFAAVPKAPGAAPFHSGKALLVSPEEIEFVMSCAKRFVPSNAIERVHGRSFMQSQAKLLLQHSSTLISRSNWSKCPRASHLRKIHRDIPDAR